MDGEIFILFNLVACYFRFYLLNNFSDSLFVSVFKKQLGSIKIKLKITKTRLES